VLRAGFARDLPAAMLLPADAALMLLDEMNPESDMPEKPKTQTTHLADGSTHVRFSDVGEMNAALIGAGWNGVRIGRRSGDFNGV
jgi:hypothetical protein